MKKKVIARIFGISEDRIYYTPGNIEEKTVDTYSFDIIKRVKMSTVKSLMESFPTMRLEDSIITQEGRVLLRIK